MMVCTCTGAYDEGGEAATKTNGDECRACGSPRWRGRYSQAAINDAAARLGLKHPVRVTCDPSLPEDEGGAYETRDWVYNQLHHIKISPNRSLYSVNHHIGHELGHAVQAEREGPALGNRYQLYDRLVGYERNPFELEADQIGAALFDAGVRFVQEGAPA